MAWKQPQGVWESTEQQTGFETDVRFGRCWIVSRVSFWSAGLS